MNYRPIVLAYVSFILLVVGCNTAPVADDVAQREANEIVAVLSRHDISARLIKTRGGKGRYSVVVSESDFGNAAEVLNQLGLPTEKKPTFQELTALSSIIPPSREVEALRLDRAIASELEDLFRVRNDLGYVSVLVRMHSKGTGERPAVTAVIQKREAKTIDVSELKEVIRRSVPGIEREDIYVSVIDALDKDLTSTPAGETLVSFLGIGRVVERDHAALVLVVVGLVLFSAALGGLAGYLLGQFNWLRKQGVPHIGKSKNHASRGGKQLENLDTSKAGQGSEEQT